MEEAENPSRRLAPSAAKRVVKAPAKQSCEACAGQEAACRRCAVRSPKRTKREIFLETMSMVSGACLLREGPGSHQPQSHGAVVVHPDHCRARLPPAKRVPAPCMGIVSESGRFPCQRRHSPSPTSNPAVI